MLTRNSRNAKFSQCIHHLSLHFQMMPWLVLNQNTQLSVPSKHTLVAVSLLAGTGGAIDCSCKNSERYGDVYFETQEDRICVLRIF